MAKRHEESFIMQARRQIDSGNKEEAQRTLEEALNDYTNKVLGALTPYPVADAPLIVISLRHIADEIERTNNAKELVEGFSQSLKAPVLQEKTRFHQTAKRGT